MDASTYIVENSSKSVDSVTVQVIAKDQEKAGEISDGRDFWFFAPSS